MSQQPNGRAPILRHHQFEHSGYETYNKVPICTCGSDLDASVHRPRERTDEERAAEARRIGER